MRLAAGDVYVTLQFGMVRVNRHVYNDEADVDRFMATQRRRLEAK